MTKKQFTDTICKTFDLKGITPNSFVYAVNCILIGIVMVWSYRKSIISV